MVCTGEPVHTIFYALTISCGQKILDIQVAGTGLISLRNHTVPEQLEFIRAGEAARLGLAVAHRAGDVIGQICNVGLCPICKITFTGRYTLKNYF